MTVLRSREVIPQTPAKALKKPTPPSPLDPFTPARTDPPPPASSPNSSLVSESDPSAAAPSRRRSLRLASLSKPTVEPVATVMAETPPEGSGKRRRTARVSRSPDGESGGNVQGEARVLEAVSPFQADGKMGDSDVTLDLMLSLNSSAGVGAEGRHMNLRWGLQRENNHEKKGKGKLVVEVESMEKGRAEVFLEVDGASMGDREVDAGRTGTERKFSAKEKGKGKLVVEKDWLSIGRGELKLDDPIVVEDAEEHSQNGVGSVRRSRTRSAQRQTESRREADRNTAIKLASKFAFFKPEDEEKEDDPEESMPDAGLDDEDWPGPFSTAMKIIEEREAMLKLRESNSALKKDESRGMRIQWTPSKYRKSGPTGKPAPSLKNLCLKILSVNAEEIESLEGVPDVLKHALVLMLCRSRKMSAHALGLLTRGCPVKILLSDCSWATEEQIEGAFAGCYIENIKVVQLDLCGRCMTDYVLRATLARSPNCLPSLTTLSLKGAYRLSDDGLNEIVTSAPLLNSINLGQCSLLTSNGIISLANKLDSVLRELYIDDCQNVDAMLILPALKMLKYLEVLSVARIQTVCDKFVKDLISCSGSNMRELVFAGCCRLTSSSMKVIGEKCSRLCALDLQYLNRLNDSAIGYIANGCRLIQKLKLRRNRFSDEATAAFLEASGESLTELSLNNVVKVAQHTAVAISRRCSSTLNTLDLSYCREMTDEALGLIVDSCACLKILKLFGCTQVTDVFLNGHSNPGVKIIGLKEPILEQIEMPELL